MKKFLSYFVVFLIGFIVCAGVLRLFYGVPGGNTGAEPILNIPRGAPGLVLAGEENPVRTAAKKVSEYVVNIDTVGQPVRQPGMGGLPDFFGFPFSRSSEVIPKGQASGVIFRPDDKPAEGYILTNNHVVEDAAKLTVTLRNGKSYPAKVIGRDPKTDLAVIKIDAKTPVYAKWANSDTLEVGDWTLAVGNALGRGWTVTLGVVSATKRGPLNIDGKVLEEVIQTDAAINRGNSGGALADINGNLVGINTAIESTSPGGGNIGIGFAVPSNMVKKIANDLVREGKVTRPWLGIYYFGLNEETRPELEQHGFNLPKEDGAFVQEVVKGSPADQAGIQAHDIIIRINDKPVSGKTKPEKGKVTIADEIAKTKIGQRVPLEVWRPDVGQVLKMAVRVAPMPADAYK